MTEHVVLVGMGVGEPNQAARLDDLANQHDATVAYLQLGDPSLSRELTRLADSGAQRVVLVGVAFATAPGSSWLRRIAAHWWRERVSHRPDVAVASGLLDTESDLPGLLARTRSITGTEAGLTSDAWEELPGHRHQVFVCRGPRCTTRGADDTADALTLSLMAAGLGDDDVLVTQTGCQFPCNHAPVVSVQPEDVWYGDVDGVIARAIVDQHLVAGQPVQSHRLPRHRGPSSPVPPPGSGT